MPYYLGVMIGVLGGYCLAIVTFAGLYILCAIAKNRKESDSYATEEKDNQTEKYDDAGERRKDR